MNLYESEPNPYTASLTLKESCLWCSKALDRFVSTALCKSKTRLYKAAFHYSTITSRQCCVLWRKPS